MKQLKLMMTIFCCLFIATYSFTQRVQTVAGSSATSGYSGDGGLALNAQLNNPFGIASDSKGNIFIADFNNNVVRKIDATTGIIDRIAGLSSGSPSNANSTIPTSCGLSSPRSVVVDAANNIYIADEGNNVIKKISITTGFITIIAGTGTAGFSGEGAAATAAMINHPRYLALDNTGNLYFSDYGNQRIRKINATGNISTVAGGGSSSGTFGDGGAATSAYLSQPQGIAFDGSNNLYIADNGLYSIRKVNAATGIITTYAGANNVYATTNGEGDGGVATSARFFSTHSIAISNNLMYITDKTNNRIRVVNMTTNIITTFAGGGTSSAEGIAPTSAYVAGPVGICANNCGIFYTEYNSSRIREISSLISGTIQHAKTFGTQTTSPIKNVDMNISGTSPFTANGSFYYPLPVDGQSHTITPSKNNDVAKANGVNATDVLFVQRHILNTTPFTNPYKFIAADVNDDGSINATDVLRIKRLILATDFTFPSTYNSSNRLWAFVNSSSRFATTNPLTPLAGTTPPPPYSDAFRTTDGLNACQSTPVFQGFYGVKLGDVNWDWNPSIAKASPIQIYFNDINATESDNITIPVRVNNFTDISGVQFSLSFDPTHFEYYAFENDQLDFEINSTQANAENNNGVMSFIWVNDAEGSVTLDDGSVLFYLTLHKKKSVKTDDIVLTSDLTKVEAVNNNLELIPISKKRCKIIDNSAGSVEKYRDAWDVLPNYNIMGNLLIKATSREHKTVTLQVYDKDERLILETNRSLREGDNMLFTNLRTKNALQQGVYYVKLVGMEDAESKPLFVGDIDEYATPDDIANGDISSVATINTELALYALQTQLYKQLMADPSLANTTALQNFVTHNSETNIDKIYKIEYALTDGENASAASQIESFTTANTIDVNYKNYYSWVLKLLNHEEFSTTDESNLNILVVQCPLTAGMVVHNSRDLSNYLTENNTIFGDVCPVNNTASRSLNNYVYKPTIVTPKPIIRNKQSSSSLISVYPNPTKGLVHISIPRDEKGVWNITVQDVLGRVLQQQTTTSLTRNMDIAVSSNTGFYYITMTNKTTNKKFVEKVVVE